MLASRFGCLRSADCIVTKYARSLQRVTMLQQPAYRLRRCAHRCIHMHYQRTTKPTTEAATMTSLRIASDSPITIVAVGCGRARMREIHILLATSGLVDS
jgi:hypothetical protein